MIGFIKNNRMTLAVYALTVLIYIVSFILSPSSLSWRHLMLTMTLASFLIVVSYGQGIVILVRGLDLSVGSMITLSGVLVGAWIGPTNEGFFWAIPLILLILFLLGSLNGAGVAWLGVPPFVMTLATGIIIYSVVLGFTKACPSKGNAPSYLNDMMLHSTVGIPNVVYLLILFIIIAVLVQHFSTFGRKLYALGANPSAAHIIGLRINLLTIAAYGISGLCCGLVGIMLVGYSDAPTLRMGEPYVMASIAAVVIGGSSILGGKGNYVATVGGVLLLTILSALLTALGLSKGWRTVIQGSVIIGALIMFSISGWTMKYNSRKKKKAHSEDRKLKQSIVLFTGKG